MKECKYSPRQILLFILTLVLVFLVLGSLMSCGTPKVSCKLPKGVTQKRPIG